MKFNCELLVWRTKRIVSNRAKQTEQLIFE